MLFLEHGTIFFYLEYLNLHSYPLAIISYIGLLQFTYKAKQGLHLIMKFDYFDKDINSENGDVLRKTFGIELYPLNMFEIDFLFRQNTASTIEIDNDKKNEFLMQVHSWF